MEARISSIVIMESSSELFADTLFDGQGRRGFASNPPAPDSVKEN